MRKSLILLLFIWCKPIIGFSQDIPKVHMLNLTGIVDSFYVDSVMLNQVVIPDLNDSGQTIHDQKEGYWVEYVIDSSSSGDAWISTGVQMIKAYFPPCLRKEAGLYINNRREGQWTTYYHTNHSSPLHWKRLEVAAYVNGLKNGYDSIFSEVSQKTPSAIEHYKNGELEGRQRHFYSNGQLDRLFTVNEGDYWTIETYYEDGQVQSTYRDTTIMGFMSFKKVRTYFPDGTLSAEGLMDSEHKTFGSWKYYYEKGSLESIISFDHNGDYELEYIFHPNEQMWTYRTYQNGLLWNIEYNLDSEGNKRDPGSLKDGTGTVILYNYDGTVYSIDEYVNGKRVYEADR